MVTKRRFSPIRLYEWMRLVPEDMAPEHRRAYYVALITGVVAGLYHFLFLVFFAAFGLWPLVYVNCGSVFFFALVFLLVRRTGNAALGMTLVSVELIVHQVLAVYYLGWDYGFQYYLFIITGIYIAHHRSHAVPGLCILLSAGVFGWLYLYGQHLHLPHLGTPEPVRVGVFWFNLVGAVQALAAISFVYARTAIRMERELEEQNRALREAQLRLVQSEKMAAIGKLVAGLTHEINTPIGAILSGSQTGVRAIERIREQEEGAVGRTARILEVLSQSLASTAAAAQRLDELGGRLKGFVHLDEAEFKTADIHQGIDSTLALLHSQIQENAIEVIRRFDPSIPPILCQPAEINQVLMHLLQNSIEAIEGPGTIRITTSHHDTDRIAIDIQDTGKGLKEEELEDLFNPSFSAEPERIKMGMGLPISHQIVTRHQGELRVESCPGEGAIFTVFLPKQG